MELRQLVEAVQGGDRVQAADRARDLVESGVDVQETIGALTQGMREIGDQFARMEIFLPEMMKAAKAMQAAMGQLEPALETMGGEKEDRGTIVIGTVEGDMHEIGKDIVITMLEVHGFEVHDLGIDVNALEFIHRAEAADADVIGASALMTTTMPNQREIIELLKEKGLRDKFHVILGGAPVTPEWVEACGADSWGENAAVSVEILTRVVAERGK
ncbi:MAG: cobalamin-dependent protein [Anaerolineae bacterium]|jgi:corrinoid protein of di/trimethylamine methyltransferase